MLLWGCADPNPVVVNYSDGSVGIQELNKGEFEDVNFYNTGVTVRITHTFNDVILLELLDSLRSAVPETVIVHDQYPADRVNWIIDSLRGIHGDDLCFSISAMVIETVIVHDTVIIWREAPRVTTNVIKVK